ncbi:MAG: hypothetical protein FJW37_06870 [Acidobacteria bacterium]|nr:hypothetical protein [Acidobacteriota bacterium]
MSPARALAFRALVAVERGAYAADFLAAQSLPLSTERFERSAVPGLRFVRGARVPSGRARRGRPLGQQPWLLSSRDAALASGIVFGVLRYQAQLDFLIEHYSGRSGRLDPEVRIALRAGIYQLRYLERVPAHAAVAESVEWVKQARKRSAAGFVNAVLRKVTRDEIDWPTLAIELSQPAWLLEKWIRRFGRQTAIGIARANLSPPEAYIRIPPGANAQGIEVEPTEMPGCFRLISGDPGGFRRQDIGSQAIVPLLELAPGLSFLDICAAPGNKTAQALESGVRTIACDLHPRRAAMLRALGVPVVLLDGARPLPFRRPFERILLDAPCSGTGTLARNPEIKWRLKPEDIDRLHELQVAMLSRALEALAPGGLLVYSTCSLEQEENEDVIRTVSPDRIRKVLRRIPGRDPGDGFFAAAIAGR